MVGKIKIGKLHIRFVLRHRFEKTTNPLDNYGVWRKWEIGMWFRKYKAVGQKNFKEPSSWKDNLANVYQVGIELFIIKTWIEIDYGVKHLEF